MDQEINDRGIMIDPVLVKHAIECDEQYKALTTQRAYELTGLENPNSPAQIKDWLADQGIEAETLDRKAVKGLLEDADGDVLEVLKLRLLMAKTSVKKYEAIDRAMCSDGRVHGLLQFYGANRTGRWAGRLVQVQNLPQNHIPDLALARDLVKAGRYDELDMLFDSTPNVLSELIRTAFVPRPGTRFIVADFSAIEARVIAWLSGEQWRLDVFRQGGDIYCASASQMFGVPVEKHGQNSHLRQKGKIAELALGYGGSVGALTAMGALEMGLAEEELPELVKQWRAANPHITKLWWDVDAAATKAVEEKAETSVGMIRFVYQSKKLFVVLPSGRKLCYMRPDFTTNRFGNRSLCYMGVGENKKWTSIETYGPKLVENIVQAIARDLLALAMLRLRNGYSATTTRLVCAGRSKRQITELHEHNPQTVEEMCEFIRDLTALGHLKGVRVTDKAVFIAFPLTEDENTCAAYQQLGASIFNFAKVAKRVQPDYVKQRVHLGHMRVTAALPLPSV